GVGRAELDGGGAGQVGAGDRHRGASSRWPEFGRDFGDGRPRGGGEPLQAFAALVAPLLLIPVEVAVDHLVVARAIGGGSQRRPVFGGVVERAAFVAVLRAFGAVPGVELRVGGRLVVLVAEPAHERAVGG